MSEIPPNPDVDAEMALKVALYLSRGMKSNKIAKKLEIAPAKVTQLKRWAEEYFHYLQTSLTDQVPEELLKRVERNLKDTDMLEDSMGLALNRTGKSSPKVYVTDGEDDEHRSFLQGAAARVCGLIKKRKPKYIGVLWGHTVSKLVDIIALNREIRKADSKAIPLCGDPLFLVYLMIQDYSASHVAQRLEGVFRGGTHHPSSEIDADPVNRLPTLSGVPAYIGKRFDRQKVMDFVSSIPGHRKIFGTSESDTTALIHRVEMTLAGVGGFRDPPNPKTRIGMFLQERLEQEMEPKVQELSREHLEREMEPKVRELERLVVGDFAGILLPRDNLSERDRETVVALNEGWTGATEAQLRKIAKSAKDRRKPGNVLICSNPQRAAAIWKAIRMELVNTLIVSPTVAARLNSLVVGETS